MIQSSRFVNNKIRTIWWVKKQIIIIVKSILLKKIIIIIRILWKNNKRIWVVY